MLHSRPLAKFSLRVQWLAISKHYSYSYSYAHDSIISAFADTKTQYFVILKKYTERITIAMLLRQQPIEVLHVIPKI